MTEFVSGFRAVAGRGFVAAAFFLNAVSGWSHQVPAGCRFLLPAHQNPPQHGGRCVGNAFPKFTIVPAGLRRDRNRGHGQFQPIGSERPGIDHDLAIEHWNEVDLPGTGKREFERLVSFGTAEPQAQVVEPLDIAEPEFDERGEFVLGHAGSKLVPPFRLQRGLFVQEAVDCRVVFGARAILPGAGCEIAEVPADPQSSQWGWCEKIFGECESGCVRGHVGGDDACLQQVIQESCRVRDSFRDSFRIAIGVGKHLGERHFREWFGRFEEQGQNLLVVSRQWSVLLVEPVAESFQALAAGRGASMAREQISMLRVQMAVDSAIGISVKSRGCPVSGSMCGEWSHCCQPSS